MYEHSSCHCLGLSWALRFATTDKKLFLKVWSVSENYFARSAVSAWAAQLPLAHIIPLPIVLVTHARINFEELFF